MTTGIPILGITGWNIAVGTSAYPGDTFYRTAEVGNRGLLGAYCVSL